MIRLGLKRVHIHTNEEAVEVAMKEALQCSADNPAVSVPRVISFVGHAQSQ
ncbi:MAG: hypothetical protein ACLUD2_13070 [Clostridium sp.]